MAFTKNGNSKYLNEHQKELFSKWNTIMKKTVWKNSCQFENVPVEEKWKDWEIFFKDTYIKYLRAKVKWKNYKKLIIRKNVNKEFKQNPIFLIRKVKEKGYVKNNIIFTNPSEATKYCKSSHKYLFDDKLLGTRDIRNILKKQGIILSMENITERVRGNINLFTPSSKSLIKWKGKYRSFVKIAELENISYHVLKKRYYKFKDIKKAVDSTKNAKIIKKYEINGKLLNASEISELLSKQTGLKKETIRDRFKKYGYNIEKLTAPLNSI